ncbi:MAG: FAD:protein FMN transferase [Bacteroidia bacterium]|nr:FAD:protein FMN transferase [Bacteroidia bacterium]
MGTRFEITATAENQSIASDAVNVAIREIERIEALISSWQRESQTSLINRNAGIRPVEVDRELFQLINRSLKISALTGGAFDISFASMNKLYQFDKKEHSLPSKNEVEAYVSKIDWKSIILDFDLQSVFLKKKGMRIGFGGIGKGYAANKALDLLKNMEGVKGAVINASGDLITWGDNGKENGWPIQISDPADITSSLGWLTVEDMSVVTSGNYEKYFTSNGTRYAHIIDPRTGYPTTGIKSVTIISPDAEIGDALATSIFVLGLEQGLRLINQLKDIEGLIITDDNELHLSENLKLNQI